MWIYRPINATVSICTTASVPQCLSYCVCCISFSILFGLSNSSGVVIVCVFCSLKCTSHKMWNKKPSILASSAQFLFFNRPSRSLLIFVFTSAFKHFFFSSLLFYRGSLILLNDANTSMCHINQKLQALRAIFACTENNSYLICTIALVLHIYWELNILQNNYTPSAIHNDGDTQKQTRTQQIAVCFFSSSFFLFLMI